MQSFGLSLSGATDETVVTSGAAHTKGSWTSLGTATADFKGIDFQCVPAGGVSTSYLVDLRIGGDTVVLQNMQIQGTTTESSQRVPTRVFIPYSGQNGDAIECRCQCVNATQSIKASGMLCDYVPFVASNVSSHYGANTTTSLGTPVDPGTELGPEQINNGAFTSGATGWTLSSMVWSDGHIESDIAGVPCSASHDTVTFSNTQIWRVSANIIARAGTTWIQFNGTNTQQITTTGVQSWDLLPATTGILKFNCTDAAALTLDDVSVKAVGVANTEGDVVELTTSSGLTHDTDYLIFSFGGNDTDIGSVFQNAKLYVGAAGATFTGYEWMYEKTAAIDQGTHKGWGVFVNRAVFKAGTRVWLSLQSSSVADVSDRITYFTMHAYQVRPQVTPKLRYK